MKIARFATLALLGLTLFAPSARADAPQAPTPAPSSAPTAAPAATPTATPKAQATPEKQPIDGTQALFRLLTGNTRFVENRSIHADQGAYARFKTSQKSRPWSIVVTCSDSRVPPEIVFDQGLGDMFVVRTWGSYMGETTMGSLQHAVEDHEMNLILVLGHSQCVALKSIIENRKETGAAAKLVASLAPAVAIAHKLKGDLLDNACKENARLVAQRIMSYPFVASRLKSGKFRVVAAYYDLKTGHVKVLNLNRQP